MKIKNMLTDSTEFIPKCAFFEDNYVPDAWEDFLITMYHYSIIFKTNNVAIILEHLENFNPLYRDAFPDIYKRYVDFYHKGS